MRTQTMFWTLVLALLWSQCWAVETKPQPQQSKAEPGPGPGMGVETLLRQLLVTSSAQCEVAIRENAVLRQRLRDLGQENFMDSFDSTMRSFANAPARAQLLLQQAVHPSERAVPGSVSVLVTPSPTWTTSLETVSVVTTVTQAVTTLIPIILRGAKITTTIIESQLQTVTTTELKTHSTLITPTPTWTTLPSAPTAIPVAMPVTMPVAANAHFAVSVHSIPTLQKIPKVPGLVEAHVQEIAAETSPAEAKVTRQQLERIKESFFVNSAQRSAQRYGDLLGKKNRPNAGEDYADEDEAGVVADFDQQGLAAHLHPVFVTRPTQQTKYRPNLLSQLEVVRGSRVTREAIKEAIREAIRPTPVRSADECTQATATATATVTVTVTTTVSPTTM